MKTNLAEFIKSTPEGQEADSILRTCVHCGFCTATCPTYQLLGDELDSPRGRIYLMKEVLEGNAVTAKTQMHLDRCLTCRACETTCPSGVQYGRLVDIGRNIVDQHVAAPLVGIDRAHRIAASCCPGPRCSNRCSGSDSSLRPLLPGAPEEENPEGRREQHRMAGAAPCAQDAGARRLCATFAGAGHQSPRPRACSIALASP